MTSEQENSKDNTVPSPVEKIPLDDDDEKVFVYVKLDKKENKIVRKGTETFIDIKKYTNVEGGEFIVFGFKGKFYPIEFPDNLEKLIDNKCHMPEYDNINAMPYQYQFKDYTFVFGFLWSVEYEAWYIDCVEVVQSEKIDGFVWSH
jgi:hypothetical protein